MSRFQARPPDTTLDFSKLSKHGGPTQPNPSKPVLNTISDIHAIYNQTMLSPRRTVQLQLARSRKRNNTIPTTQSMSALSEASNQSTTSRANTHPTPPKSSSSTSARFRQRTYSTPTTGSPHSYSVPTENRIHEIDGQTRDSTLPLQRLINLKLEKISLCKTNFGEKDIRVVKALLEMAVTYIGVSTAGSKAYMYSQNALLMLRAIRAPFEPSNESDEVCLLEFSILTVIAISQLQLKRVEAARDTFQQILQRYENRFGSQSIANVGVLIGLARCHLTQKDLQNALDWLHLARDIVQKSSDVRRPRMASLLLHTAQIHRKNGDFVNAIHDYELAKQELSLTVGEQSIDVAHVCYMLVDMYSDLDRYMDALPHASQCHQILCNIKDNGHEIRFMNSRQLTEFAIHVQVTFGFILMRCGKSEEAISILESAIEKNERHSVLSNAQKANTYKMLGSLYMMMDKLEDALNIYKAAASIYCRLYADGVAHPDSQSVIRCIAEITLFLRQQAVEQHKQINDSAFDTNDHEGVEDEDRFMVWLREDEHPGHHEGDHDRDSLKGSSANEKTSQASQDTYISTENFIQDDALIEEDNDHAINEIVVSQLQPREQNPNRLRRPESAWPRGSQQSMSATTQQQQQQQPIGFEERITEEDPQYADDENDFDEDHRYIDLRQNPTMDESDRVNAEDAYRESEMQKQDSENDNDN